jgi:hypothetical protein
VKRPNAPRTKWDWPPIDKDGKFKATYLAYLEDVQVCYDLVEIAKGVLNRPLFLKMGGQRDGITGAYTQGYGIYIPKMHPQRRISTKHELAHHYYDSDASLRLSFVTAVLVDIEKASGKLFGSGVRDALIGDMCFFVNVLDDIRVNSLWGLLYPGDGDDMHAWYFCEVGPQMKASAEEKYEGDISALFPYAILLCLKQDVESTRWGRFKDDIIQCAENVRYKTFPASLLLMRRLVLRVAEELSKDQQDEPDKSAWGGDPVAPSLVGALSGAMKAPSPPSSFVNDNGGFDFKRPADPQPLTSSRTRALMEVDVKDDDAVDDVLVHLEGKALDKVADLLDKIQKTVVVGDWIKKTIKCNVKVVPVRRGSVLPCALDVEDVRAAEKWRSIFVKVMGSTRTRMEDMGPHLATDLYLQASLQRQPIPCYRREAKARGFRVTLLVDLSGSMSRNLPSVERLVRMLQIAMNFPFVHIKVMGFNCVKAGELTIYDYQEGCKGLVSSVSSAKGLTPLSHAIQFAGRSMAHHRKDEKHLFLLGDGLPYYLLEGGKKIDTRSLMNWTGDAVNELDRIKVRTWAFMIGAISSDAQMDMMFGTRHWRNISPNDIAADSFNFIRTQFVRYLKR